MNICSLNPEFFCHKFDIWQCLWKRIRTNLFVNSSSLHIFGRVLLAPAPASLFFHGCIIGIVTTGNVGRFDEALEADLESCPGPKTCFARAERTLEFFQSGAWDQTISRAAFVTLAAAAAAAARGAAALHAAREKGRAANCSLLRQISGRSLSRSWNYSLTALRDFSDNV